MVNELGDLSRIVPFEPVRTVPGEMAGLPEKGLVNSGFSDFTDISTVRLTGILGASVSELVTCGE
jgi:hypothetical protein